MSDRIVRSAARRMRAMLFLGTILIVSQFAHATPANVPASKASNAARDELGGRGIASPKPVPANPNWDELTPAQRHGLEPLANEWNKLDSFRKNKWLVIGNKFARMKPEEQKRLHDRMREWAKLTPEQRRIARESYARAKRLNPDQKSARWKQYQQLPEEQKKKLAADAASRKHVATLLPPNSQGKHRGTLPTIKSSPKRMLERSVTPQATRQSAIQSSSQPAQDN